MILYSTRIKQIETLAPNCSNIKEFSILHQYLYRWALKNKINLKTYFHSKSISCNISNRVNKGIDCYYFKTKTLYKHYDFVADALRDLNLTYYYIKRVLSGEIDEVNGYYFAKCK